mmetsp:Transcript_43026/g.137458  ORF Transcript_43026/g.137458 Transcript_43026/m.137458 type:complete len:229 (-) Transcript_43026:304-990(-)
MQGQGQGRRGPRPGRSRPGRARGGAAATAGAAGGAPVAPPRPRHQGPQALGRGGGGGLPLERGHRRAHGHQQVPQVPQAARALRRDAEAAAAGGADLEAQARALGRQPAADAGVRGPRENPPGAQVFGRGQDSAAQGARGVRDQLGGVAHRHGDGVCRRDDGAGPGGGRGAALRPRLPGAQRLPARARAAPAGGARPRGGSRQDGGRGADQVRPVHHGGGLHRQRAQL